jgi:predicted Fe-Mo cluster-binding NifX family protein
MHNSELTNIKKLKIAVPTETDRGLEDTVSKRFGKAKTFTIVTIEEDEVKKVQIINNPATAYPHGAGPVAVKTLVDNNVDLVIIPSIGQGASSLLEHCNIKTISAKPNEKVVDSVKKALKTGE